MLINVPRIHFLRLFVLVALLSPLFSGLQAQEGERNIIDGHFLLQLKKGSDPKEIAGDLDTFQGSPTSMRVEEHVSRYMRVWLFTFDPGSIDQQAFLRKTRQHPAVTIAQFEHRLEQRAVPNDPLFTDPDQYQYINDGSNGGTVDADIDADLAWDITTGGTTATGDSIVVAVIDGGFDIAHEDLSFFRNQAEVNGTNGVDDDNNGYVDDVNGWDVYNNDGSISSSQHGTHVSGTVGAKGDNNTGFVGVNWSTKVLPIQGSSSNESTVVSAYDYVVTMRHMYDTTNGQKGAFVVATNSSFGVNQADPSNYPLWCGMYDTLGAYGILNAVAGPNADINIDQQGDVPGACPSPHTLCLTNTDKNDVRGNAGYGPINVDLGAPGTDIISTTPGDSYGTLSGTSMSTPHVAGAIGLLYSVDCPDLMNIAKNDPDSASLLIKDAIMTGVDTISSLDGITVSEGRLNIHKALLSLDSVGLCDSTGCFPSNSVYATNITDSSVVIIYNNPSAEPSYDVRYREVGSSSWIDTSTTNPDSLTIPDGLQPCTNYEFQVQCPDSANTFSDTYTFQTTKCCDAPSGLTVGSVDTNSARVFWGKVPAAGNYSIRISPVGSNTWTQFPNIQDTTYLLTGLLSCVKYELELRSDCDSTMSGYSTTTFTTSGCEVCNDTAYCDAKGLDTQYEWIERVQVGAYNNSSGDDGGYKNFASTPIAIYLDSVNTLELEPGFASNTYEEHFRVWIDLDRDRSFNMTDELIYESGAVTSMDSTSFSISGGTYSAGSTRMRVSMKFDTSAASCGDHDYGEVEDYCVSILEKNNTAVKGKKKGPGEVSVFPNPAVDRVHFRVSGQGRRGTILLYDQLGKVVRTQNLERGRASIGTDKIPKGTYFYSIRFTNSSIAPENGKLIIMDR